MTSDEKRQRVSTLIGTCIVPAVLERCALATTEGLDAFLRSQTFALLSDPATGMWHLSPTTLAEIYKHEVDTGELETPEEQS